MRIHDVVWFAWACDYAGLGFYAETCYDKDCLNAANFAVREGIIFA